MKTFLHSFMCALGIVTGLLAGAWLWNASLYVERRFVPLDDPALEQAVLFEAEQWAHKVRGD